MKRIFAFALVLLILLTTLASCTLITEDAVFLPSPDGDGLIFALLKDHTMTEFVIPEMNTNAPVTQIGVAACIGSSLERVTIPKNVKIINSMAFADSPNLKDVIFSEGSQLQSIGQMAFARCPVIESISLPEGTIELGSMSFWGCPKLTSISLPDSLTKISTQAFEGCVSLKEVHIPTSLSSIGSTVFNECPSIERFTIDESNPYFDVIDGNLYTEGGIKLIRCAPANKSTSFTLPRQTVEIEPDAFSNCIYLENIYVEQGNENYTSIDGVLFSTIGEQLLIIGDLIKYPAGRVAERYSIPVRVFSVEPYSFKDCLHLKELDLCGKYAESDPDALIPLYPGSEVLDYWAIVNCPELTTIHIPGGFSGLSLALFENCPNLTDIYFSGTIEKWNERTKSVELNHNAGSYVVHCTDGDVFPHQ